MGDDIESGYGLITDEDRLYLLDSGATLKVASLLEQIEQRANIKLRVWREHRGEEMVTSTLELLASGN